MLGAATARGFRVPPGAVVRSAADARVAAETLRFPCVLKPAIKTPTWQAHTKAKVFTVRDRSELIAMVDRCLAWSGNLLLQEWVPGGDENCYTCNCYLTANGRAVASYVSRNVRQWPPQVGIGCLSVESHNQFVRNETVCPFQSVGFQGLGYVEFKFDERCGEYFIIEPNVARPTGRSSMAEAGGVELLYTMYADAVGEPIPSDLQQSRRGVKWVHLRQDVRAAWSYWRAGELTFREWRDSMRGPRTYAIFSWSDPLPFLSDLWKVARRALRRQGRLAWNR